MKPLRPSAFLLALITVVALATISVAADPVPAKVVGVSDGDTITVVMDGQQTKIRLWGIDAPEKGQDFGQAATDAIKQLTAGRAVTVQAVDRDRYGRTVAMVYADGISVNEAMIREGAAWVFTKYCTKPICSQWNQFQQAAQAAGIGLWRNKAPVPPWEWRRGDESKLVTLASASADAMGAYIGNTNSRKFHAAGCRHAGCKHCTAVFSSRSAAIAAGYVPCKVCNP